MKREHIIGGIAGIAVATAAFIGFGAMPSINSALAFGPPAEMRTGPRMDTEYGRPGPNHSPMTVVAETIGITEEELFTALQDGQTIAEVAEANDVALEDVVAAAVVSHEDRLQTAIDNGRLTEEEMQERLDTMTENLTTRFQEEWQPMNYSGRDGRDGRRGGHPGHGGHPGGDMVGPGHNPMTVVAETIGITEEELFTALQDGQTIAEVAEANDVALEDVVAAAVVSHEDRLQTAVDNGRLTEEEMQERLDTMTENLTTRFQEEAPACGPSHSGRPMPPRGPRGN